MMIKGYIKELFAAAKRAGALYRYKSRTKVFPHQYDIELESIFSDTKMSAKEKVEHLNKYFISSFINASSLNFTRAYYPGLKSCNGPDVDAMEGFSRMCPLLASVLKDKGDHFV